MPRIIEMAPNMKLYHAAPKQVRPMLKGYNVTQSYDHMDKNRNKQDKIAATTEEICHEFEHRLIE